MRNDVRAEEQATSHPSRNIELKCRCADLSAARRKAVDLGAQDMGIVHQRDNFLQAKYARLKLRDFGDGTGELISYRRRDFPEARSSDYHRVAVSQPAQLADALAYALGTAGVVTKRRHLFLYRNTRIHLDEVDGLGNFIELETVIAGRSDSEAHAELEKQVATALGLRHEDRVAVPYVDLSPP